MAVYQVYTMQQFCAATTNEWNMIDRHRHHTDCKMILIVNFKM